MSCHPFFFGYIQAVDESGQYIAVGGEGSNVQVWSLAEGKEVFRGKGGKPNM
jgi:hypothetical protein